MSAAENQSVLLAEKQRREIASKITWRLVPFLFCCYILNYMDRINVGFAKLAFQRTLGFSDAVFGFGLSLFFIGYLLFEVPSNLLLAKFGARRAISRIMILWGIATVATLLVKTPVQFYLGRFLLGLAEAGFVPGVVLYLSYWYDTRQRARVTSLFMLALPIAGVIGNPISGFIMSGLNGVHGIEGWQWLFLLEGIPPVLIGIFAFFYLTDRPKDATWLTSEEQDVVARAVETEERLTPHAHAGLLDVLKDYRVYLFAFAVFSQYGVLNVFVYWGPTLLKDSGLIDIRHIGLYGAIPLLIGAVGMYLASWHSDLKSERLWHAVVAQIVTIAALVILPTVSHNTTLTLACMTTMTVGCYAFWSIFWSIPPAYFQRDVAAAGISVVNCLGALGAVFASNLLGQIRAHYGRIDVGLYVVAAIAAAGAVAVFVAYPKKSTAFVGQVSVAGPDRVSRVGQKYLD